MLFWQAKDTRFEYYTRSREPDQASHESDDESSSEERTETYYKSAEGWGEYYTGGTGNDDSGGYSEPVQRPPPSAAGSYSGYGPQSSTDNSYSGYRFPPQKRLGARGGAFPELFLTHRSLLFWFFFPQHQCE